MDAYLYFTIGTVAGFWIAVLFFGTLLYRITRPQPQLSPVKTNVRDLYPPKDNN